VLSGRQAATRDDDLLGINEGEGAPIRIKIEINTREREAYDPPVAKPLRVENPWSAGEAGIPTFSIEEMLATKLRALLQRNKGRDLVDLRIGPRLGCRRD
jgi:predicted nucleotidyltransferase component of viral defense system